MEEEIDIDISQLSQDIRDKLAELGLDLSEGNDSNFLVRVDPLVTNEKDYSSTAMDVLKARNIKADAYKPAQNIGYRGGKGQEIMSGADSADKENVQPTETSPPTLSDLNVFIPLPLAPKKFLKPTLPSILELSYEEGMKAQSLASRSSSACTISDYVDAVNKHDLSGIQNKSREARADHSKSKVNQIQVDQRTKYTKSIVPESVFAIASKNAPSSRSYSNSGTVMEKRASPDSWDEFDKVMDESFVAEDYPRFEKLSVTQRDLELDDAGFKSFTSLEAKELMDRDEAERLQLLTSPNGTLLESFFNGNGEATFDRNVSMGAYFGKRSSTPFKRQNDSFVKAMNKKSSSNFDSVFLEEDVDYGSTSSFTKPTNNRNVLRSESFRSMHEDDEFEPLKLPDTSLDTLGKFFMGPQSTYLSGNPQGMMDYIIDYCRQTAEKTMSLDQEQIEPSLNDDPKATNENLQFITRRSSGSSSGVSSNKTLTPKSGALKTPPKHSNTTYGKYQDAEYTDDQSVVIAGHGLSGPSFGISESILEMENTLDNARYAKFEENLKKSIQEGSAQLDRLSERGIHFKNPVALRSNRDKTEDANSVTSAYTKQMSLEMLRRDSLSPPERLITVPYRNKGSVSSLDSNAVGAHSTPLQQSLSASLAKELGLENMASKYDSPLEFIKDRVNVQRPIVGQYNFVNRDKVVNSNTFGKHPYDFKNSAATNASSTSYNVDDTVSGKDADFLNNFNRVGHRNITEEDFKLDDEGFKSFTSVEAQAMMDKDEAERLLPNSSDRMLPTVSTRPSIPKTNPHINQVSTIATSKRSTTKCTDSGVQTSFLQPKTSVDAALPTMPNPFFNQGGNINQIVQSQNFGYPLIIQIHCACSGGVNVVSNQPHSSTFVPATGYDANHNDQKCIEPQSQPLQSSETVVNKNYKLAGAVSQNSKEDKHVRSGGVNVVSNRPHSSAFVPATGSDANHNHQKYIEPQSQPLKSSETVVVNKNYKLVGAVSQNSKEDKHVGTEVPSDKLKQPGPPPSYIEVDKMSLCWGFVDFGQTEMNTLCISNKENIELRFKATIVEKSYLKNFKFVLDPSDNRIKENERMGVLLPFSSKKLMVNFSPVIEGPISASIELKFHSLPFTDVGFRGEIPLIARAKGSVFKNTSGNTARAGDDIKIQNTNMNFGKLMVGKISRKVTTITNNSSSTVKFIVSPPNVSQSERNTVNYMAFISSVSEGTIAKGASREIIFTYKPSYFGKHSQIWTVDVTFVYSSIQMTKTTSITLDGEAVILM